MMSTFVEASSTILDLSLQQLLVSSSEKNVFSNPNLLIIKSLKYFTSSKTTAQIQVTVGQLSLILPDPGEMRLQVRGIYVHENYDNMTKVNDIAMLEV
jgi:hypothetical protein